MKRLFRILVAQNAPRLKVEPTMPYASEFEKLDGKSKAPLSPREPFRLMEAPKFGWQQILDIAPGGFVLSEDAWEECEDLYHIIKMGSELLAAKNEGSYYIIINPVDFAPQSDDPTRPYKMDTFNAPIFRLEGNDPTHLFCLSGTDTPDAEFKHCYEKFRLSGLIFEEVWNGE